MKPNYYRFIALYFFVCLPLSSIFANEDSLFAKIRTAKGIDFIINIYAAIPYFDSLPIPQKQAAFVRYESCIANATHLHASFYAKYINGYAYRSTKKDNLFTLKIYLELLKIAQDKKEDFLIYFALRAVGLAYTDLGNYSEAYEYIQKAIALDQQNNNQFMLSNEVFEIGDYFLATKDYLKAISFYQKGLRMPENPNQFYKMLYTDMIGVSLVRMESDKVVPVEKNIDSAIYYYSKSLAIAEKTNKKWAGVISGNMGFAYSRVGNTEKAIELLEKDVAISSEAQFYKSAVGALVSLARIKISQDKLNEAIVYMEQAKSLTDKHQIKESIVHIYGMYYEYYKRKKDYEKALYFFHSYTADRDSLDRLIQKDKLDKLQYQYNVKSQEEQIGQLKKDQHNQEKQLVLQYGIIGIVSVALVLFIIFSGIYYRSYKEKQLANVVLATQNEEIQQQQEAIMGQAEKLRELNQVKNALTEAIIHDLKTPLSVIMNKAKDEEVLQATRQMQNMVLNVLEVEQLENVKMMVNEKPENINLLVKNSIEQIEVLAKKKNIAIENLIYQNTVLMIDNILIERVLVNLLSNAIRHTDNNGKITFSQSNERQSNFISYQIIDNGQGVAEAALPFIFDKYFQVKTKGEQKTYDYRPSGLGLTFCKMVIEAHGGEIWAESQVSKGTTIHFSLPLAQKQNEEIANRAFSEENDFALLLTIEEKLYLKPFIEELQKREIVEYSALKNILGKIDEGKSSGISVWKVKLTNAVAAHNESEFKKIVQDGKV